MCVPHCYQFDCCTYAADIKSPTLQPRHKLKLLQAFQRSESLDEAILTSGPLGNNEAVVTKATEHEAAVAAKAAKVEAAAAATARAAQKEAAATAAASAAQKEVAIAAAAQAAEDEAAAEEESASFDSLQLDQADEEIAVLEAVLERAMEVAYKAEQEAEYARHLAQMRRRDEEAAAARQQAVAKLAEGEVEAAREKMLATLSQAEEEIEARHHALASRSIFTCLSETGFESFVY